MPARRAPYGPQFIRVSVGCPESVEEKKKRSVALARAALGCL